MSVFSKWLYRLMYQYYFPTQCHIIVRAHAWEFWCLQGRDFWESQTSQSCSSGAYSFALYMEAVFLYEMLVNCYQNTRYHIPDDSNFHLFFLNKENIVKITITA